MKGITDFLLRVFVRNHEQVKVVDVRVHYGFLEAWVSIIGNFALFVVKLVLGLMTQSIALIADAFHSLGDLVTSVIVLFGFRVTHTPADLRHPYGHGRAEPIATLIIAILLVVTGIEFIHVSFDRLRSPVPVIGSLVVIVVMLISTVFKEWMARFSIDLGQRIESDMLKADAWHHRSDAIASLLVVIAMVGARLGYSWLDGLLGMAVGLLIAGTGFHLARSMVNMLMGVAPPHELIAKIVSAAGSTRGVQGVHDIQVHDYGRHQVAILHIEVAPEMSTEQSHAVATEVEETLTRRLGLSPVVHVDLRERPKRSTATEGLAASLTEILAAYPQVAGFHGLFFFEDDRGSYVEVHLQFPPHSDLEAAHFIGHQVAEKLSQRLSGIKVNVHTEPVVHASGRDKPGASNP